MSSFSQRWGRVGKIAGTNLVPCAGNKAQAQSVFTKKFHDKTKNKWEERRNFQKVAGKYDLLEMDYAPSVDTKPDTSKVKKEDEEKPEEELKCQLDDKIQVSVGALDDVVEVFLRFSLIKAFTALLLNFSSCSFSPGIDQADFRREKDDRDRGGDAV